MGLPHTRRVKSNLTLCDQDTQGYMMQFFKAIIFCIALSHSFFSSAADDSNTTESSVKRGEYLSHLGDCVACHTDKGGKAMAGGLELKTPFGALYSTNITPDKKTGIGGYSFEQFDKAMRRGVAADGHNLYPAMPYPSYSKMSVEDMQSLYQYLMHGVLPVEKLNIQSQMKWPYNMRWGLSFWNILFGGSKPYEPEASQTQQWNRGAYIVQGMGHCGSCHTPRGLLFQEKAMSQAGSNGKYFLSGSTVDSWHAVNLRNLWTPPEIVAFLKTGRNQHATAYGTMTEVIGLSTQHFTDEDLTAIAVYLKSLSLDEGKQTQPIIALEKSQLYKSKNGLAYVQFCSTCHRNDGKGVSKIFPPLAGNKSILSDDPTSVIHVVLSGWKSAATKTNHRIVGMPEYGSLSDEELAGIITFIRSSWGNSAPEVTDKQIKAVRTQLNLASQGGSKFVTPRFSMMLEKSNSGQLVYGMRLMSETGTLLPNHVGNSLNCSSCHTNAGTVANASPFVGVAAQFPAYAPRAGKIIDLEDRINGCFKRSMNGKALEKDSVEMKAIVAYMKWLNGPYKKDDQIPGRGIGKIDKSLIPNIDNGRVVYQAQCAVCHGSNGEGVKQSDGRYVFPMVWGDESFNLGAGMARTFTAAAFIKQNMPMGHNIQFPLGQGGSLGDQEALDVAEYFAHMARPDFIGKEKDWPNGGKPKDARY